MYEVRFSSSCSNNSHIYDIYRINFLGKYAFANFLSKKCYTQTHIFILYIYTMKGQAGNNKKSEYINISVYIDTNLNKCRLWI